MSTFWTIWVPLILIGVFSYGYHAGGFIGEWVQGILDPLLSLGHSILNFIFGV